jgi:hypothetical protein
MSANRTPASATQMPIGAYYQSYRQPKAFLHAVSSFRTHYPDSTLVVTSDNGFDYSSYIESMSGVFIASNDHIAQKNAGYFANVQDAVTYLQRFLQGVDKIDEDYFILLEDDVMIYGQVSFDTLQWDITGTGTYGRFDAETVQHLRKYNANVADDQYYSGCGGSIFNTTFMKRFMSVDLQKEISEYQPYAPELASDLILSYLVLKYGGTVGGPGNESCEVSVPHYQDMVLRGTVKVVHQYKSFYDEALSPQEEAVLQLTPPPLQL